MFIEVIIWEELPSNEMLKPTKIIIISPLEIQKWSNNVNS